jgi:site-specific recombinase XerD
MELQPLKVRFYPKKRSLKSSAYTLYMRMVLRGQRTDLSLNYELSKESWDDGDQTMKSKHPDRGYVLNLTNKYRQLAFDAYQQLIQRGMAYDVNIIRKKVTGSSRGDDMVPTLMKLFNRAIERKKALKGPNNSIASIQKYSRCKAHLQGFLELNYHTDDIRFPHINLQFVEDFELYLKTEGKCCHNTTMKHIQTFKTIYRTATAHGYTDKDPFQKYRIRMEEVVRDYLTDQEIDKLIKADNLSEKLTLVRDLFLFSCFTGLAYIDVKNLQVKHLYFENCKYWIRTRRHKTNVKTNVPLLAYPMQLIYRHCPDFKAMEPEESIFRVISNQKMNDYLKELAGHLNIPKRLTFHIARHTFATTVTLNNGVPIESVSAMLGHKHISTTQHYAKMLDKKLEADMDALSQRLNY